MARRVRFRVLDGVAVVTLDAPPVNALATDLRAGLWDSFQKIAKNDTIKAACLMGSGALFSAGANVEDFETGEGQPRLAQLCDLIEGQSKPVVAALNGPALGGGAELALACHYRVAVPQGRIGLPEVALGLVPSAGGTQRLPRLVGADKALQMMISTHGVEADVGRRIGLFDGVVQGDLGSGGIGFAQALIKTGKGPRPVRNRRHHLTDAKAYFQAVNTARQAMEANPLHAPRRVIDCVEAAAILPFEAGLAFEADAFDRCLAHPQSVALRHVFKAERRIDGALIERDGTAFKPVAPMGKSVVQRLSDAMKAAADVLVSEGASPTQIDGAMVAYGFRRGPFGGRDLGAASDDIVRRLLAALVAEGGLCVAQGAVQQAADVDVLAVHGMGFPRRMGGPMRATQSSGLIQIRKDMRAWSQTHELWAVPEILDEAIKHATGFDAL